MVEVWHPPPPLPRHGHGSLKSGPTPSSPCGPAGFAGYGHLAKGLSKPAGGFRLGPRLRESYPGRRAATPPPSSGLGYHSKLGFFPSGTKVICCFRRRSTYLESPSDPLKMGQ